MNNLRTDKKPLGAWILLCLIIVVSGYFHFSYLRWDIDSGTQPHPDERAMVGNTLNMLSNNNYTPENFTWGHFGYYSVLFAYKGFLYVQNYLNGYERDAGEVLRSVPSSSVPHLRDMLADNSFSVTFGVIMVLLCCLAYILVGEISKHRTLSVVLLVVFLLPFAYFCFPVLKAKMLVRVNPNDKDIMMLGRFMSAFTAVLSVPIIYAVGRKIYSTKVGVLAAAFVGFTVLGMQLGRYYCVDMLQAFCIIFTVWVGVEIAYAKPNSTTNTPPPNLGLNWLSKTYSIVFRHNHAVPWKILFLYVFMGIGIGASLASKFSSLPILVLPVVVHAFLVYEYKHSRHLMTHTFLVLCYALAFGTFYFLEPRAFDMPYMPYQTAIRVPEFGRKLIYIFFSERYAKAIVEQSEMVACKNPDTWKQQFVDTIPYVTHVMQMIRWTFGWPLGILCVFAFFSKLIKNINRPNKGEIIVLAWTAVVFAITCRFKATFPRYTMGFVPFMALFAADLCVGKPALFDQSRPFRKRIQDGWLRIRPAVLVVALLGAFFYCSAFMSVYRKSHTWVQASLWVFKNLPAKNESGMPAKVLHEGWDDPIPCGVGNYGSRPAYRSTDLNFYEGDGDGKVRTIAAKLAEVDYICLATPRLYGTTAKVPLKYAKTIQYYKMLFAGKLGFTLEKTVTSFPELWGFEGDTLKADESTSVYDHPKSVIFRKTRAYTPAELYDLIMNTPPEVDALSRDDLMAACEGPKEQLLNIFRDPYCDQGAFTIEEIKAKVDTVGGMDQGDRDKFMEKAKAAGLVDAYRTDALRSVIEPAGEAPMENLPSIKAGISGLERVKAVPVGELLEIVEDFEFSPEYSIDRARLGKIGSEISGIVKKMKPEATPDIGRALTGIYERYASRHIEDREALRRELSNVPGGLSGDGIARLETWIADNRDRVLGADQAYETADSRRRQLYEAFRLAINNGVVPVSEVHGKLASIHEVRTTRPERVARLSDSESDEDATQVTRVMEQPGDRKKGKSFDEYREIDSKPLITAEREDGPYQIMLTIKWLLIAEIFGLAVLPVCIRIFGSFRDMGYPLAKTLGLVLATYVLWLGVNFRILYFSRWGSLTALCVTAAVCCCFAKREGLRTLLREKKVVIVVTELVFLLAFAFFAIIRAYNPEIFWGEKPMDSSLLNSTLRGTDFPPYEPWYSGTYLNYYYYGIIIIANICKLGAIPTAYGFNLAIGYIGALAAVGAFSIGYNLTHRYRYALLTVFFLCFIGNLDPFYQMFIVKSDSGFAMAGMGDVGETGAPSDSYFAKAGTAVEKAGALVKDVVVRTADGWFFVRSPKDDVKNPQSREDVWHSYWASSRATGEGMINEYPVWSLLFADLHAHVIVIPISVLMISFIYLAYSKRETWGIPYTPRRLVLLGLTAILAGSQMTTNIWDFPSYLLLLGISVTAVFVLTIPWKESVSLSLGRYSPLRNAVANAGESTETSGISPSWETYRCSGWTGMVLGILFVAVFTYLWPYICKLHPYWLGCVRQRSAGFSIGIVILFASVARGATRWFLETVSGAFWGLLQGLWKSSGKGTPQLVIQIFRFLFRVAIPLGIVVGLSYLFFYHFHANLNLEGTRVRWNRDGNLQINNVMRHFGLFLILIMSFPVLTFVYRLFPSRRSEGPHPCRVGAWTMLLIVVEALLCAGLYYFNVLPGKTAMALYYLLIPPVMYFMILNRSSQEMVFAGCMLIAGLGIAITSETVVIIDRMNTVFKFYHHAWVMFAIGTAAIVSHVKLNWIGPLRRIGKRSEVAWCVGIGPRVFLCLGFWILVFLASVCTYRGVYSVVNLDRRRTDKPTLNGYNFLSKDAKDKDLLEAMTWINENVGGAPVILEAHTGEGYDGSTRVVQYTGLPTLLGWPHHTKQRGHTEAELRRRKTEMVRMYTSEDDEEKKRLFREYNVKYVFIGDFERRAYGQYLREFEKTFEGKPYLRLVYPAENKPEVFNKIYEVLLEPTEDNRGENQHE